MQQTSDGGYIVAGVQETSRYRNGRWQPDTDVFLGKVHRFGKIEWTRKFQARDLPAEWRGEAVGNCVRQTSDGRYIVAGYTTTLEADPWDIGSRYMSFDVYLIKTDDQGNMSWARSIGRAFDEPASAYRGAKSGDGTLSTHVGWNEVANSVQQTADGGYIAGGSVDQQTVVMKLDAAGNKQWSTLVGGWGYVSCARQTSDGGYVVAAGDPWWVPYLVKLGPVCTPPK